MSKKLITIFFVLLISVLSLQVVSAQSIFNLFGGGSGTITTLDQFTSTTSPSTAITQRTFGKALRLSGQGSGCAQFDANGIITSTGSACGTGSGSASPATSTNPLMATYFIATSTTLASTFTNIGIATTSTAYALVLDDSVAAYLPKIRTSPSDNRVIIGNNGAGDDDAGNESVISIGYAAGQHSTNDAYAIHIGRHAGNSQVGQNAVQIGHAAGQYAPNSGSSVSIGALSDQNYLYAKATNNNFGSTHVGYGTGLVAGQGLYNVIIGYNSGQNFSTGWQNVLIGDNVGNGTGANDYSVMIGSNAGGSANTTSSIYIGRNAGRYSSVNNRLAIDSNTTFSGNATTSLIYGEFDNRLITINGKLGIATTSPYAKLSVVGETVSAYFTATTTSTSTLPRLSSTGISADWICLTGDTCRTTWPSGGGSFSWTPTTNYGISVNATSTPLWFQNGFMASTTSYLPLGTWTSAGYVGIGTSSPTFPLSIIGTGNTQATNSFYVVNSDGVTTLKVGDSGNISIGYGTSVTGTSGGIAIGYQSSVTASGGISIGNGSVSGSSGAFALGNSASSLGSQSVAIGNAANVRTGLGSSIALGASSDVRETASNAFALGNRATVRKIAGAAIGYSTDATGIQTHLLGSGLSGGTRIVCSTNYTLCLGSASTIPTMYIVGENLTGTLGMVGIGTTSPGGRFSITQLAASTTPLFLVASSTNETYAIIDYKGNVGIGTTSPYAKLSVTGTSLATTPVFAVSTSTATDTSTAFSIDNNGQVQVKNAVPYYGTGGNTAIVCYMSDGSLGHITITSLLASGNCVQN